MPENGQLTMGHACPRMLPRLIALRKPANDNGQGPLSFAGLHVDDDIDAFAIPGGMLSFY